MSSRILRVGIDARAAFLDPNRGLGRVARQLTSALLETPSIAAVVFVPGGARVPRAWYRERVTVVHLRRPVRGAFLWDGPAWMWTLRHRPVDVLYLPAWGVPPGLSTPVVSTLHDAIPIRFPTAIRSRWTRARAVQRLFTHRRATLVHTNSQATATDAVHVLGIPSRRVRPALLGVDPERFSPDDTARLEHVLYVGGGDEHKRVGLLLDAWSRSDASDLPPLVVAGSAALSPGAVAAANREPDRVRCRANLDDSTLRSLYRSAYALVVPSLWEGFGLPVLEAMACGCPAVVTKAGALPEAGGDAAVYISPEQGPVAWRDAVRQLVTNRELRERRAELSIHWANAHSWSTAAESLLRILVEAATTARPTKVIVDSTTPTQSPAGR